MINIIISLFLLFIMPNEKHTLYDFNKNTDPDDWVIVDDRVMGGVSQGAMDVSDDGHGIFTGDVSTANNGGFSSVYYHSNNIKTAGKSKIVLRVKGDGKTYQFRVKDNNEHYYSFIKKFKTSGQWETIEINLNDMYASFRGRRLDMPNFEGDRIEEIRFLIANKKNESFKLLIDKIEME